jgi:hypothetical protein
MRAYFLTLCLVGLAGALAPRSVAFPRQTEPASRTRPGDRHQAKPPPASQPTRFVIRNVNFRVDDTVILEIRSLRGTLLSRVAGSPPNFDDKDSLLLQIIDGEAAMSAASFSDLLNRYVFNYPGTPLTHITVSTKGDLIQEEATMHKGVAVRTQMTGGLEALPDGRVRFHPHEIKAGGIPAKGLMDVLGLKVAKLIKGNSEKGVEIVGDDLIMDLSRMIPAPHVRLRVTAVHVEGDRIVESFGPAGPSPRPEPALTLPDPTAANYFFYRGGTVKFGKLTMQDTELQLVDADPEDPFDFFLDHYYDQLVAGYTKNLPDRGLLVVVPDFARLGRGTALTPAPGPAASTREAAAGSRGTGRTPP